MLDGHHDEWNRWAVDQVNWLHANGRMFQERQHIHTSLYEKRGATRRDPNGCTIELALDHNYPGLVVVAGDVKDGHTHNEVDTWFRDTYLPERVRRHWGPDLVLDATTLPLLDDRPADVRTSPPGPTGSFSCTSSITTPRRGGPTATPRSATRSTTADWRPTCGPAPSSRPTSAPTRYTDELW